VRVALMIEGQEGVTWEQWLAIARACEDAGIDALFRSDHYISFFRPQQAGSLDAWTTLAGIAAVTTKLRLGTLVSPVTFRHPSLLARAAVTVDHISGGRVEIGIGGGWNVAEHEAFGFPFPETPERMELLAEQIEILHRELTEERFDFEGAHYTLEDSQALPKPVQKPRPPIVVGGSGKRGTAIPAARFADEYNTPFVSPEEFAARRDRVCAACEELGRDPGSLVYSTMTTCTIGDDNARRLYELRSPQDDFDTWRAKARATTLIGSVDEIAARLREYEQAGCERVMLQHLLHDDVETIGVIGRELAPAVA
jgi:F420-dependent oxidoreductase-like protein